MRKCAAKAFFSNVSGCKAATFLKMIPTVRSRRIFQMFRRPVFQNTCGWLFLAALVKIPYFLDLLQKFLKRDIVQVLWFIFIKSQ